MNEIHLDLFSGIGGASIAVDAVFGPNIHHIFVENESFPQAVLKKHWPDGRLWSDVRTFTADSYKLGCIHGRFEIEPTEGRHEAQREPVASVESPFILTSGTPCQPASQAGKRRGTADDRWLWPDTLRIIGEVKPKWCVLENPTGLLSLQGGLPFEQICSTLETQGYEVFPIILPAVAVNAPHRRDRVWIVAHAKSVGGGRNAGELSSEDEQQAKKRQEKRLGELNNADSYAPNSRHIGQTEQQEQTTRGEQSDIFIGDTKGTRQSSTHERPGEREYGGASSGSNESWNENWLEVATRLCRLDDGLSSRLVRLPDGRKISYSKWRQEALKGLGNAWVPAVAIEIMKAIKKTDDQNIS